MTFTFGQEVQCSAAVAKVRYFMGRTTDRRRPPAGHAGPSCTFYRWRVEEMTVSFEHGRRPSWRKWVPDDELLEQWDRRTLLKPAPDRSSPYGTHVRLARVPWCHAKLCLDFGCFLHGTSTGIVIGKRVRQAGIVQDFGEDGRTWENHGAVRLLTVAMHTSAGPILYDVHPDDAE